MIEFVRFYKEGEANDAEFAAKLAENGDILVSDAFSCSHRAHASVEALARETLSALVEHSRRGGIDFARLARMRGLSRKWVWDCSAAMTLARSSGALLAVRAAVLELRGRKSMLLDPRDENVRSAGSFFLNPVLDATDWQNVRARIEDARVLGPGETIPQFAAGPGQVKLAAAWLIERAGFSKGMGEGPVGLSTKHTLAIVNRGGAQATDILRFARRIRDGVYQRFGVRLVPEPVLFGFDPDEVRDLITSA